MAVIVGSARSDENGRARCGAPGDQTGREVSTQNWYRHSKGWRVFRPISAEAAEKMARAMQAACDNPNIGYDQGDRLTLYYAARDVDFDPARVKTKCETDCSALVRVCAAYAGIKLPNFTTDVQPRALLESHEFVELVGAKYTDESTYLKRGDVLVTRTQGHTVIVLSDGPKAETAPTATQLGERILRNGDAGEDVRELQEALIELGYNCGRWGADGDFGDATERAVRKLQLMHHLERDGVVGPLTWAAIREALKKLEAPNDPQTVRIVGGSYYVRGEPNTSGDVLGVVKDGSEVAYGGEISADGWLKVYFDGVPGWVSPKGGRLA